jgi:hypothetical protein
MPNRSTIRRKKVNKMAAHKKNLAITSILALLMAALFFAPVLADGCGPHHHPEPPCVNKQSGAGGYIQSCAPVDTSQRACEWTVMPPPDESANNDQNGPENGSEQATDNSEQVAPTATPEPTATLAAPVDNGLVEGLYSLVQNAIEYGA